MKDKLNRIAKVLTAKVDKKQLKYFINKYDNKLGDSLTKRDRDNWVDGIGELNDETKKEIIKQLDKKYGK